MQQKYETVPKVTQRPLIDEHVSADKARRNTSYRRLTQTSQQEVKHHHSVLSHHNQADSLVATFKG